MAFWPPPTIAAIEAGRFKDEIVAITPAGVAELTKRGVKHEVLNAKYHEQEAAIVAEAGRKGAVTVATNMAGRGTDIMLGGNPEFMAVAALKQRGPDPEETPEEYEASWDEALTAAATAMCARCTCSIWGAIGKR